MSAQEDQKFAKRALAQLALNKKEPKVGYEPRTTDEDLLNRLLEIELRALEQTGRLDELKCLRKTKTT